ncbi:MAG: zinc metallopeptidase [Planctomycetota bacterium]
MMPGFFDWTFILLIPGVILGLYAQMKVHSAYTKFSRVISERGISGARVAQSILQSQNLIDVTIEQTGGELTDHYDPRKKVIRLSSGVYNNESLSAVGIAAHETGHAIQHATGYLPVMIRNGIYPIVGASNYLWMMLFLAGIFMSIPVLITVGIYLFAGIVVFQIVTLPTEFNASNRAMALLTGQGIITENERPLVRKVLNAAALTYVAATLMAILQLIRLILISRNRR